MLIKVSKVSNPTNVLVQLPKHVTEHWGLRKGDGVEMYANEDGSLQLRPRKGFAKVRARSNSDEESERTSD